MRRFITGDLTNLCSGLWVTEGGTEQRKIRAPLSPGNKAEITGVLVYIIMCVQCEVIHR